MSKHDEDKAGSEGGDRFCNHDAVNMVLAGRFRELSRPSVLWLKLNMSRIPVLSPTSR